MLRPLRKVIFDDSNRLFPKDVAVREAPPPLLSLSLYACVFFFDDSNRLFPKDVAVRPRPRSLHLFLVKRRNCLSQLFESNFFPFT